MAVDDRTAFSRALARLGAVAELLSLAAGEIVALASLCGDGLRTRRQISIDGRFETLALLSALPAEPAGSLLVGELTRRDRMFGGRAKVWLERGDHAFVQLEQIGAGLGLAMVAVGPRPIAEDLTRLRGASHAGGAIERAAELLAAYEDGGGELVSIIDRYRPPAHHSWTLGGELERGDDTDPVLGALARSLEIRPTQTRLLADMHPILGGRHDTRFAVRIGPGVVYPELHLTYRDVDIELLIRLLVGLDINRDPGEPLGRFLGALGAPETASVVELVLVSEGPPRVRVGVELD